MREKDVKKIKKMVLKKIVPTKKEIEAEKKVSKEIIKKILKTKAKHSKAIIAGSTARNTHLREDKDIDLFVMFPKKTKKEELEKQAMKIAKKVFPNSPIEIDYGQHPYLKIFYKNHEIELIPSYEISSTAELLSSVDRTPFHNSYLEKKLSEKQRNEVRLLKKFLKGIECYGAETKTQGFSGYITELLILNYRDFEKTIKAIANWKTQIFIDLENKWKKKEAIKKFHHCIIIIDPVDEKRNAAAAITKETLSKTIRRSKEFLKKPGIEFFFPKTKNLSKKELESLLEKKDILLVKIPYKKVHEDVTFGQLRKIASQLENELHKREFKVAKKGFWSDEKTQMLIMLELKENNLEETKKIIGPPIELKEHLKKFLEAHPHRKKEAIKNKRIVIEIEREHKNAKKFVEHCLEKYKNTGIEKFIVQQMQKSFEVLEKKEIIKECGEKEIKQAITKFLTEK